MINSEGASVTQEAIGRRNRDEPLISGWPVREREREREREDDVILIKIIYVNVNAFS